MLISTTDKLDCSYDVIGVVIGSTIQTVNVVRDLGSSLKTLVGGELIKGLYRDDG